MPFGRETHESCAGEPHVEARARDMDAGLSLVALLSSDRGLDAVRGRLPEDVEVRVRAQLSDATDRAALVRGALSRVRPRLEGVADRLPRRLAALVSASLPRAEARRVLADAPLVRASYDPARALLECALRIARSARAIEEER